MSTQGYNVPAGQQIDGVYDHTKPWRSGEPTDVVKPRWTYDGPWASNMERLTSQAIAVATMPGAAIQELVRPPLPQIRLFPDRFGFGERTQPTIDDVVSINRNYMEPRVSWYSGSAAGYSGSSRNSLQDI
jgi:hypothetical protein